MGKEKWLQKPRVLREINHKNTSPYRADITCKKIGMTYSLPTFQNSNAYNSYSLIVSNATLAKSWEQRFKKKKKC